MSRLKARVTRRQEGEAWQAQYYYPTSWMHGRACIFDDGSTLTLFLFGASRPPADLVFVIKEGKHPRFTRKGNDLHTTTKVRFAAALPTQHSVFSYCSLYRGVCRDWVIAVQPSPF